MRCGQKYGGKRRKQTNENGNGAGKPCESKTKRGKQTNENGNGAGKPCESKTLEFMRKLKKQLRLAGLAGWLFWKEKQIPGEIMDLYKDVDDGDGDSFIKISQLTHTQSQCFIVIL